MSDPRAYRAGHNWGVEMQAVLDWWISLWHHGLVGLLIALIVAAFVLGIAGNVVIWTLAGVKTVMISFGRAFMVGYRRSGPEDPHQQLRVIDERPVDHR